MNFTKIESYLVVSPEQTLYWLFPNMNLAFLVKCGGWSVLDMVPAWPIWKRGDALTTLLEGNK